MLDICSLHENAITFLREEVIACVNPGDQRSTFCIPCEKVIVFLHAEAIPYVDLVGINNQHGEDRQSTFHSPPE